MFSLFLIEKVGSLTVLMSKLVERTVLQKRLNFLGNFLV